MFRVVKIFLEENYANKKMGYNSVRKDDLDSVYRRLESSQNALLIINVVMLLIGLANFSICIWIRFDLDFWEWVEEIDWYSYWNAMYVVMIAMILHAVNSMLSAYATYSQSRALLITSVILRVIVWFVTLAGIIVICLYGVEESKLLIKELDQVFKRLIHSWDDNERASRIMIQIQEYVGCCGARRNYLDYINVHKAVPESCRHPVSGNRYRYGCPQTVAWWLEPWTSTLAGVSLGFCMLDFMVIYITVRLRSLISMTKQ